tara:strand:+ start:3075 stop:4226 length:1152 start_codon:yes stop_codon:yes gene_type:complete
MKIRLPFIATVLFTIQVFIRRILFLPSSYIVPYFYFYRLSFSFITNFYFIYILYSFIISTDRLSTIIYSTLFIFNTFVYNSLSLPSKISKIKIDIFNKILRNILIIFSIFSFILWSLNIDILPNKIYLTLFNPLNGLNINSYIFIIYYFTFAALYLKKSSDFFFGCGLLLLTESRTGLVFLIFLVLQYLDDKELLPNFSQINLKIIIPFLTLLLLITPLLIGTSYLDNIKHNVQTSIDFANNIFIKREQILNNTRSGIAISDGQRLCLTGNNLNHINKTFPIGTGIGLKSYQNSLEKYQLGCRSSSEDFEEYEYTRAHNFYISYLAEMGIFFFPLFFFLAKNIMVQGSRYIIVGLLIAFLGHEYLTSPYTWMVLGLSQRRKYD